MTRNWLKNSTRQQVKISVIAIMIEKASAMEQLDEILSVKGIDMVVFGPCDYAISIGEPGQWGSPEVKRAERVMIEKALKKGIQPRPDIGSFEEAKDYINMGVRHFAVGEDLSTIYQFVKRNGEKMRELLA